MQLSSRCIIAIQNKYLPRTWANCELERMRAWTQLLLNREALHVVAAGIS